MTTPQTQPLAVDRDGKPIPQTWNPRTAAYEAIHGDGGAMAFSPTTIIRAAPVPGAKTITTTAASLFAGASAVAGRYQMTVYNDGAVPVFWGGSGVTVGTGFPLFPGDFMVFHFAPTIAVPIFFIASASTPVRVVELS